MAGGIIVAGELWVPGQKLISIPNGKVFTGSMFRLDMETQTLSYIGPPDKTVPVSQFYDWLRKQTTELMLGTDYDTEKPHMVSLKGEYRLDNPEHLTEGTLSQAAADDHCTKDLREMWTCTNTLGSDDLFVDKIYYQDYTPPRERIRTLDNGHRGYR
jgi:hypothetical protein